MGFLQNNIQKTVTKGGHFRHTFIYNGSKKITRINPLCDCVKYKINLPELTFWYKVNKTTTKIVVITYDDESSDFLQLQSIAK
jgi:hypothetical protein